MRDALAHVVQVGFVASFVSKLSDTVSSEIGKVRRGNPALLGAFVGAAAVPESCATEHLVVSPAACGPWSQQAYGRTTFLITTFQRVPRGTEGAVSAEGTAAGMAAAFGFSLVALALGLVRMWCRISQRLSTTMRACAKGAVNKTALHVVLLSL